MNGLNNPRSDQSRPREKFEPSHFAYIDAIRGLAFLGVLAIHAATAVGHFFGRNLFLQGSYGVQLFFLASAVTLCHSMSARQKIDRFPVLSFYLRRLFRIAPLFWIAMIFYWTWPGILPACISQPAPGGVHPSYFVLTSLFLHGWHPYTFNSIVPGGWSIAVEMTFYAFFPLVFYFLNFLRKTIVAVLLGIFFTKLAFHFIYPLLHHHLFPGTLDVVWNFFVALWFPSQFTVFLIGFLTYHLLRQASVQTLMKNRPGSGGLLCFCGLGLLSLLLCEAGRFMPAYFLVVLALAGIIVGLSGKSLPWLVNPVICYLGKISYSCYLVHFAALRITLQLLGIHLTADSTSFDAGNPLSNLCLFLTIFTTTLFLTAAISTVTFHLIENPGIALGRKTIHWINALTSAK